MTRIFSSLAMLNALLLVGSVVIGFASQWRGSVRLPEDLVFPIHFYLGLVTAMVTLLVHCLIFTYFLGTGRWVKEVALAYGLPDAPLPRLTRELKRRTFPPALFAMLITIATTAAGAGAQQREWPWLIHATLAILALGVNLWAFLVEYRGVRTNGEVIDDVLREVDRIRAARGLPSNAEALREE